jgi:16S rRNA (guanine527-N7)-methyltransferase
VPAASLEAVLAEGQRIGLIGPGELGEAIEHSLGFAALVPMTAHTLVDLGSGGGLPGLVLAGQRPDLAATLIDRRGRATDFLTRSVQALGLQDRVRVETADAREFGRRAAERERYDVATSRGIGEVGIGLELARPLVRPGGVMVLSVPDDVGPFPEFVGAALAARVQRIGRYLVADAVGPCPPELPRRRPAASLWTW